jgi:hypothetical protein
MYNYKIKHALLFAVFGVAASTANAAENTPWNGTVLGFEPPQSGLLGEMLGIRPILEDNGFRYNLGYLNEMGL